MPEECRAEFRGPLLVEVDAVEHAVSALADVVDTMGADGPERCVDSVVLCWREPAGTRAGAEREPSSVTCHGDRVTLLFAVDRVSTRAELHTVANSCARTAAERTGPAPAQVVLVIGCLFDRAESSTS